MQRFAFVLGHSALALVAASGAALAQDAPKAQCPNPEMGQTCPPSDTTTDTETTTTTTTTDTETDTSVTAPMPPPPEPAEAPPPAPVTVQVDQPDPVVYVDTGDDDYEPLGIAVSLGGGIAGFTNETIRDSTNDGGAWGVRAAVGLRSYLGVEAEYTGSAQSIDALGIDTDSLLVGHGVQGALRLNLTNRMGVQPFVFGGVAWRHYELNNEGINTSDIESDDDVLEIPMGAGIAWTYENLMLDARGEFRYAELEDMIPDGDLTGEGHANMHRYGASLNLGYAF